MASNVPATTEQSSVPATTEQSAVPAVAAPAVPAVAAPAVEPSSPPRVRQNITTGLFPLALGVLIVMFVALGLWTLLITTGGGGL
jgi:hypothetical protein